MKAKLSNSKVKSVARTETPDVEPGRIYNFGEFFDSSVEADSNMIDFVLNEVRDKGISRRTVMRDALAIYLQERNENDTIGPYTQEHISNVVTVKQAAEEAKAARAKEREEKQALKEAAKQASLQEIVAEVQQVKGVNRKQAAAIVEEYPTWGKLKAAKFEEVAEVGGISSTAATAVVKLAGTKTGGSRKAKVEVDETATEAPAKSKKPAKAAKLVEHDLESAAKYLGTSRMKVKRLVESGKLLGTVDDDEVTVKLSADLDDLEIEDRLDAATKQAA